MADRTGQRIDDYQLLRLLGQGTFGEVYLAQHLYKHTWVAVKILSIQVSDEMLEDFLREARTLFLLKHPHIVPLLDFGSEKKVPFLVIEYAPNGTLRQRHRLGERVPLDVVNSYVQQVASALQYAHDQRLIHCDVKPQNMLLSQNGQVLLSDFGVVSIAHSDHSLTTQQMAGTIAYVAPEQIQGKPRPASDQYALGICVYEWLCGVRPFTGSTWELMSHHVSTLPVGLRIHVPDLPQAVEEAVLHALAKDPQERFASVTAFATALWQASQPPRLPGADIRRSEDYKTERTPSWPGSEPTLLNREDASAPSASEKAPSWPGSGQALPNREDASAPSAPERVSSSSPSQPAAFALDAPTVAAPGSEGRRIRPQQPGVVSASGVQPTQPVTSNPSQPAVPNPITPVIPNPITPVFFPDGYPSMEPVLTAPHDPMPTTEPSQSPPLLRPRDTGAERSTNPPAGMAVARRGQPRGRLLILLAIALGVLASILTPVLVVRNQQSISLSATATAVTHAATAVAHAEATETVVEARAYQNWVSLNGIMFGFDPAHTHWNGLEQVLSSGNVAQLRALWSYTTGGVISSEPAVANGILYASSQDGKLYAFDASCRSACQPLWSYTIGHVINSSPAVADGIVYIGSDDGKVYAFDATCRSTCQPLWSYATGAPIYASPTVVNGIVYIGSDDKKFYAFDASCRSVCQPLWFYKTSGGIDSSAAVANGMVYVGAWDGWLYIFGANCHKACKPLWSYRTSGGIPASPTVANGLVYIGSYDGNVYAFDATCRSACQPLWFYKTGDRVRSSAAVANGIMYIGSKDGRLYAFDAACRSACQPLWSYTSGGYIDSSPTIANGVVYIGSDDKTFYAFDASCRSACQPLWSYRTGGYVASSPTVVNGVVYIGSADHRLYAFGLGI